ncbi:MAG: hypothetical protein GXO75_14850 [Calditrichaeota bacterium]|nr:hypothetical protein [Calditrichota bacterium]
MLMNQIDETETCLILLAERGLEPSKLIEDFIKQQGGTVLLRLLQQGVLLVNVNYKTREQIKLMKEVKLVGGVRMIPRDLPKIRVAEKEGFVENTTRE